ncbi:MAG: hypothetical protein DMD93_10325 [Candidatus Rokuibacteriota bacterium]|nr:MAG: hypothetical protein DMD93_10325 [Candidatus Rokubacteria bacterium]
MTRGGVAEVTRARVGALAAALVAGLVGAAPGTTSANGETQREIQGRVVSVDADARTLVVAREFRGQTRQVTLKAAPSTRVFTCAEDRAGLGHVRAGMVVSAFYEVVGVDGVVNLIVIERAQ